VLRHDRDDDKLDVRVSVTHAVDVLVIGGGQAGLAAGYHLQRAGLSFLILEAGAEPVGSWPAYYDSRQMSEEVLRLLPERPIEPSRSFEGGNQIL
jgi:putative flavoprotein involved in K+ transport